jgi:hypothetical protein
MLSLLAAVPAAASILSATGQPMKSPNTDYLRVTTVQDELNATMRDMNDASVATGAIGAQAPAISDGAFVLQKEGDGGGTGMFSKPGSLYVPGDSYEGGRISINTRDGSTHTRHTDNNRGGGNDDPHAAPEPSTWMLLATGLAMVGGYAALRRKSVIEG